ncbi:MFS transporter [Desulfitobacterium sp.]|uniref:MFS transporter n=1 Tax=Desulfitobacterium sp. TaxID=49981 RepID=UPI002B1FE929|nr:MFS transporter [Desulfitobacterium sp.]MEA4901167.1 MFS transporter [Desulfitobacterium sp.]
MVNISARIDRLPSTPMLRKILFLCGIGWLFDAMDQGMVAGVMASIGKDWALSTGQLGVLGSSAMLGMAIGAALSGMAADRWGRRTVILWVLIIYGVASGLSGFSTNFTMLVILRFFTGFGLGGELPAASTLVSEFSPTRIRGRNVILLESFWAWGWIVAALVAYLLIPVYGWRIGFWVGAFPALFAAVIQRAIPESPRYLELRGKSDEADAIVSRMEKQAGINYKPESDSETAPKKVNNVHVSFADLWSKKYLASTIVLWVIWFGLNFGYYGFVLWTPTLLVGKGFALVKSFEFTLIMCLAQLPGYASAAYLVERIGRKKVLVVYLLGTALAAWLFGHAGTANQVLLYGCLLYFFSLGAWGCTYAYTPEVYPTVARATGSGWAAAFGRLGAFLAPMIVPVIYSAYGQAAGYKNVFIMLTVVFAVVAIVVGIVGKETMGKSLEEITD